MRCPLVLGIMLLFITACRSSRDTVEIMDADAPASPPSDDIPRFDGTVQTTLVISALSLPTPRRSYDRLDLALREPGTPTDLYKATDYKPGERITIDPHKDYDIVLSAYSGSAELYSTKFCSGRQTFRAEEGTNSFTASLCLKPDTP